MSSSPATMRAVRLSGPGPVGNLRLTEHGVDYPLLDTGQVAPAVREPHPDGVDAALDLVGTPTLPDTLRAVRVHGTACFSGSLSNQWTVAAWYSCAACFGLRAWLAGGHHPA